MTQPGEQEAGQPDGQLDGQPNGEPVDYRFLLANERTFLAYVRTGLAVQVAGLAALQFLLREQDVLRVLLGLLLVATGSFVALAGFLRWRSNDATIRAGGHLQSPRSLLPTTVAVVAAPLVIALVLGFG